MNLLSLPEDEVEEQAHDGKADPNDYCYVIDDVDGSVVGIDDHHWCAVKWDSIYIAYAYRRQSQ